MNILKEQAARITSLEIQGATNIAKFGVNLLKEFADRHKNLESDKLILKIKQAEKIIYKSRATEPAMCNGLKYVINKLILDRQVEKTITSDKISKIVAKFADEYIELLSKSKEKIALIGANRIPKGKSLIIMTHCHSSITTGILIEAHEQGKNFSVICTETRPRHQGYLTAKELTDAGIKTTLICDSAMRWAMRNFDIGFILIGADAITSEGTVLNKIGSRLLALAAREMHIPLYVATPLLKFNPDTKFGNLEKIDMRSFEEVWPEKPKSLNILNPAFETVSRRYVSGLITEAGIYPASSISTLFESVYPFLKQNWMD
ncbi:MAG: S-methyl-5-thioribose-1-phosphate isomerase [archaeon]|nr:S-methyl-5-thioribose-1-phosphate isomerase [archaeon]